MPLIKLNTVTVAFGGHPVLDAADLQIDAGERVGLIGRNGEGKSTLLKLIAGQLQADSGEVWIDSGLRVAMLEQAPVFSQGSSIFDAVAAGLGEIGGWIAEYHALSLNSEPNEGGLRRLGELQDLLDASDGWNLQQRVETTLSRLQLPADRQVEDLSGGWIRRVALARAFVCEPGLLLLDEPTNHLDLDTILWLEKVVADFAGAVLLITHDRSFLQSLATRIVDLDRGRLVSWPGNYSDYLQRKAAALQEEAVHNAEFDKKLAKEEAWIRQGIKARRTRNEGRVRALRKLREERAQRRTRGGEAKIVAAGSEKSGKRVIEAENVCLSYGEEKVVDDFSMTLLRGDRVGLIGPNGAGKTSLLKLLLRQIEPDSGTVQTGTRLEVGYFDQMRANLDGEQTVAEWIGEGSDFLDIDGNRRHVLSYLSDFLFLPQRARSPIRSLSGGEKNRLMLAKLFSRPANLLVMDEPTNDLDIETLELLEEVLLNFQGSLLLVSHDREFIDNVVTSILVFEGRGRISEYVGGYSDWFRDRQTGDAVTPVGTALRKTGRKKSARPRARLGYREKRELESLPAEIETLESRQMELNDAVSSADFYQQDKSEITATLEELEELNRKLESAYSRWDELESLQEELGGDVQG